jgi:hypothetical protein
LSFSSRFPSRHCRPIQCLWLAELVTRLEWMVALEVRPGLCYGCLHGRVYKVALCPRWKTSFFVSYLARLICVSHRRLGAVFVVTSDTISISYQHDTRWLLEGSARSRSVTVQAGVGNQSYWFGPSSDRVSALLVDKLSQTSMTFAAHGNAVRCQRRFFNAAHSQSSHPEGY